MLPVVETLVYDLDGKPHNISVGLVQATVLDEGLTDEDYTEAEKVQIELQDSTTFVCNPWSDMNKSVREVILDMFLCM